MPRRLIHINNNFPTKAFPNKARYVKTIDEMVKTVFSGEVVGVFLNSNYKNILGKIKSYLVFYFKIIFVKFNKNDILFCHHFTNYLIPFYIKTFFKKKTVIHWHGSEVRHSNIYNLLIKHVLKKIEKSRNTTHIFPTVFMKNKAEEIFNIKFTKIHISPSGGINTEVFFPIKKQKTNQLIIGFASALSKQKGFFFMVDCLKSMDVDFELQYIYYGKDKEKAVEIITNNFNNFKQYYPMDKKMLNNFYNNIDILIFPSFFESLGLVGLEAMSCGKPVLGTDNYGIKSYIIPTVNGEVFQENNKKDFIKKLQKITKNYKKYNPRNSIMNNYSKDKVFTQYDKIFNNE